MESNEIPEISLKCDSVKVQTRSRKLRGIWDSEKGFYKCDKCSNKAQNFSSGNVENHCLCNQCKAKETAKRRLKNIVDV
jgi:hypothetical protein